MMEMDVLDKNRLSRSVLLAAVIWLVLLVFLAFIPITSEVIREREFSEVKITLLSQEPLPIRASSTTAELVPSKVLESPKASTKKTSSKKQSSSPKTVEKTSSGLGIPDFSSTSGTPATSRASGETLDFSSDRPSERQSAGPSAPMREFEGSAAKVAKNPDRPGTSSVEAGKRSATASQETLSALERIEQGSADGVSAPEQSTSSQAASVSATSATLGPITFDGAARRLVYPAKPAIVLPADLARRIDSNRTVTVHFVIRADGTVPASLVRFSPSALLPPEVRDFLKNEFMSWRFERGSDDGQARFLYSITVQ